MFSGEGKLTGVSGASYEGLWINGQAGYMAVKLVITALDPATTSSSNVSNSIRVTPGQSFSISVECHTDLDELMQGINQSVLVYSSCIIHEHA